MVNTSQQVGGSVGTALLEHARRAAPSPATPSSTAVAAAAMAAAAVHGYTTAFWWSAAIFALGAIVSAIVFRPARRRSRPRPSPCSRTRWLIHDPCGRLPHVCGA